jgi:hypothetical protein
MPEPPVLFPKNASTPGELPAVIPAQTFVATRSGSDLAVEKNAPLPDVCVKCAAREGITRKRRLFTYYPPWILATLFVPRAGVLVLLVLYIVLRKIGHLQVPLCGRCRRRWNGATAAWALSLVGLFALLATGIGLLAREHWLGGALALAAGLGAPFAAHFGLLRPRTIRARKVDQRFITLRGIHPAAIDAILLASGHATDQPALPGPLAPAGSIQ